MQRLYGIYTPQKRYGDLHANWDSEVDMLLLEFSGKPPKRETYAVNSYTIPECGVTVGVDGQGKIVYIEVEAATETICDWH